MRCWPYVVVNFVYEPDGKSARQEIALNLRQASWGTEEVNSNVIAVSAAASETGQVAAQVLEDSNTIAGQADVLRSHVERFLANVRRA